MVTKKKTTKKKGSTSKSSSKKTKSVSKSKSKKVGTSKNKKVSKTKSTKSKTKTKVKIKRVKKEVSESLGEIKAAIYAGTGSDVEPTIESKEVILQNIGFELATVKQLLDRINRQLTVIESRLTELLEEEE